MKKNWLQILFHFAKEHKFLFIWSILFSVLSVFAGIVPYVIGARLIAMIVMKQKSYQEFIALFGLMLLAFVLKTIFYGISTKLSHHAAYNTLNNLRIAITNRLMLTSLGIVKHFSAGSIKNAILDRTEEVEIPLAHMIPELSANILLIIVTVIYLFILDFRLALSALLTIPLASIPLFLLMRNFEAKYQAYMQANNEVNNVMVEYIEGIEVIKTFNQTGSSFRKFSSAVTGFKDYTLDWLRTAWKTQNLVFALLPFTLLGVLPVGIWLYLDGSLNLNQLLLGLSLAIGLSSPLNKLSLFANDFSAMKQSVIDTQRFLELPVLVFNKKEIGQVIDNSVEVANVDFSYTSSTPVLTGINLKIPNNSFCAIVGPSGSGKSTLLQLLTRFWDIQTGSIMIGNVALQDLTLHQLNSTISYVTQDSFIFKGTIADNIRMGNPNATEKEVRAAARAARCMDFINKLPQGFQTEISFGNGQLSGGQQQRLSIARAILKDAPIIILDEPTASIDLENEQQIQESLLKLTKNKTVIMVAHRLGTIKNADQIIVLDTGKIVGHGKHAELLESCPTYQRLWASYTQTEGWHIDNH
ncbi:MAG: ABC transporter ATP-binding protein [Liquorilactobacillus mali]|uniref:ABC transporter ATP-binding protein n=1 Tax=Liquorilactobacillus mali TaxID=1618 RepID=UPI0039EBA8E2